MTGWTSIGSYDMVNATTPASNKRDDPIASKIPSCNVYSPILFPPFSPGLATMGGLPEMMASPHMSGIVRGIDNRFGDMHNHATANKGATLYCIQGMSYGNPFFRFQKRR